jgi:hypothetical protein
VATSDRTRKLLWGRAAGRCSACRCELFMEGTPHSATAVIGEECHIVARSAGGPRFRPMSDSDLDGYDNLILSCCNHHKLIDEQWETYTEPLLRRLKVSHERWAVRTLRAAAECEAGASESRPVKVSLLRSGQDVVDVAVGAHADDFNHDVLEDDDEVALVGGFLQSVQDWCEMWMEMEPSDHVRARFGLDREIKQLRGHGFVVYGAQTTVRLSLGGRGVIDDWRVATLRVLRASNPRVPPQHRDAAIGSGEMSPAQAP